MCSILDISSRIPCPDLVWRYAFCNNTASTHNGTFANCHCTTYCYIASNECILFNSYTPHTVHTPLLFWVQEMCENGCVLCYCNTFTYSNKVWSYTIKIDIAVYPARPLYIYPPHFTSLHL